MEIKVRNPRTGIYDYTFNQLSEEEIVRKTNAMRHNQVEWFNLGIEARCNTLMEWHDSLLDARENIIGKLTEDTGRYNESVLEFNLLTSSIKRWVSWSRDFFSQNNAKASQVPNIFIEQDFVPYDVVAVISPWNFPLLLSVIDMIPALLAGCSVIVKPSEITPRFTRPIQNTINQIQLLSSVLQYVEGDGRVGSQLIEVSDLICFTGSVETGKKVYKKAAELFKPCFLELGGKDPVIIMDGANIEHAAQSILWGSCVNNGHSCLSVERVYVQSSIMQSFITLLKGNAEKVQMAYEDPKKGHIGPLISDKQVAIINEHLADAFEKGAQLITGNKSCESVNGGYYCRPTILSNVNHTMKIMTEETFGPIIPVMSFDTEEEAIHLANDSIFGLSGGVFAATNEEAQEIAKKLKAGAISINECALTAIVHDGEKNSFKMSGIGGSRMGPSSLQRFFRRKAYLINQNRNPSPWWFNLG